MCPGQRIAFATVFGGVLLSSSVFAQVSFINPNGTGGYTILTPGQRNGTTFVPPNDSGGFTTIMPGAQNGTTFINPNGLGGFTEITPGKNTHQRGNFSMGLPGILRGGSE